MTEISKPTGLNIQWASAGDILDPGDTKYATGWEVEIPPRQWENYIQNKQDNFIAHANQHGVVVWDNETEYQTGKSYVQGATNGIVYRCVLTHGGTPATAEDPEADVGNTYWEVAFAEAGDAYTKTESDGLYLAKAQNLADITNTTTARTNLSVYSKTEVDTRNLNSTRIDVASAATVDLTTAAPNTRHINITGTTTINGFAAVAGATYFVRFNAALTLTNSASLVTQSGANILTAAGDTCVIRATANNVVEVMVYVDATVQSLTTNGYRKFKDGLIIQWGGFSLVAAAGSTQAVVYPVAINNAVLAAWTGVDTAATDQIGTSSRTLTGMVVHKGSADPSARNGSWFIIGY